MALDSHRIRQHARSLGFERVGIIRAQPVAAHTAAHLKDWLAAGYHADMRWMADGLAKRLDPGALMDGTRSIICVAMNYYTPDPYDEAKRTDSGTLKIAKYARGTDYHYVLKDRLKDLLAFIQTRAPDANGRALTDSAPILEKPLAVQAGLGWIGRNGNVIAPGLGSWIFLGELLLDIELDAYDEPFTANHCGTCRRCVDICPTDAIVADGVVDARRCLSYWTIEHKGADFPDPIAQTLSGWIFGCDLCQDVCPWNVKFAQPTAEPAFQPRPWNRAPQAAQLLTLDEDTFRARYRKSPIKRAKLPGLLRNIRQASRARDAHTRTTPTPPLSL